MLEKRDYPKKAKPVGEVLSILRDDESASEEEGVVPQNGNGKPDYYNTSTPVSALYKDHWFVHKLGLIASCVFFFFCP